MNYIHVINSMLNITLHVAYSSNLLLLCNRVYSLKTTWNYVLGTFCAHIKLIIWNTRTSTASSPRGKLHRCIATGHFKLVEQAPEYRLTPMSYFSLPRNVAKRDICYDNVCPSVCPSHSQITRKRFKILKYTLQPTYRERCFWFLKAKCRSPEF